MSNDTWSWILGFVGILGFALAGRKIWWAWYINLGCQVLWITYGIISHQNGFIASAVFYAVVFGVNAYKWTKERHNKTRVKVEDSNDWEDASSEQIIRDIRDHQKKYETDYRVMMDTYGKPVDPEVYRQALNAMKHHLDGGDGKLS